MYTVCLDILSLYRWFLSRKADISQRLSVQTAENNDDDTERTVSDQHEAVSVHQ